MEYKKCYFCGKILSLDNFHKNKSSSDGLWSWCKSCESNFKAEQKKRVENNEWRNIVSFSGGKDSTGIDTATPLKFITLPPSSAVSVSLYSSQSVSPR